MTSTFKPTEPHPVLQMPTDAEALVMGEENWQRAMDLREKAIREEITHPLYRLYEPPIWKVSDALWGAPWLDEKEADAIRRNLGFKWPVSVMHLLGAQRSSKTEYVANRLSRIMQRTAEGLIWMFHNTMAASIDAHQKLFWKYLPPGLRGKSILSQTTYVAYKDKTGFSDGSFVLPNLHKCRFLSYDMPVVDLQGLNLNAAGADEFATPEHIETLKARVAVKNGVVFQALAPIEGYTPLVQSASDGAEVVRESIAFMSPADGGARYLPGYLGLTEAETEQLKAWVTRRQKPPLPNVPWSRPEDCSKWLTGEPSQPPIPDGRVFKKVARIQKPADPEEKSAIVHFHGGDNPYGNPISLALLNAAASEEVGNRIFHGLAKEGRARMFPRFGRDHIIPPGAIPGFGTNYQWVDPAGRNWFMLWIRVTKSAAYVYREWPGNYEIPGQGVPGPWALPDGKLADGRRGPAQESFGFGLVDYKREIARLEGWKDAEREGPINYTDTEWISSWFSESGSRENVNRRFIDSRFASTPHLENDRPVTLAENLADIGIPYELTPGDSIKEGCDLINSALRFDPTKKVDALNCPRLFVSAECTNTIFALRTWRNMDGSKSATGDPIACLRYFVLQGVRYLAPEDFVSAGGGHY